MSNSWPSTGHVMHLNLVDDLDAFVTQIAARGLEPASRETHDDSMRKITYCDPDGNEIRFSGVPH